MTTTIEGVKRNYRRLVRLAKQRNDLSEQCSEDIADYFKADPDDMQLIGNSAILARLYGQYEILREQQNDKA